MRFRWMELSHYKETSGYDTSKQPGYENSNNMTRKWTDFGGLGVEFIDVLPTKMWEKRRENAHWIVLYLFRVEKWSISILLGMMSCVENRNEYVRWKVCR